MTRFIVRDRQGRDLACFADILDARAFEREFGWSTWRNDGVKMSEKTAWSNDRARVFAARVAEA